MSISMKICVQFSDMNHTSLCTWCPEEAHLQMGTFLKKFLSPPFSKKNLKKIIQLVASEMKSYLKML